MKGFNPKEVFGTDKALESEGKWIELGGGAAIKVARFNNPLHRKIIEALRKPYKSFAMSGRELPDDIAEDIGIKAITQAILMDWRGFAGDDGKPLAYSKEAAQALLTEVKDFRDQVAFQAMQADNFRQEELADAGNALPPTQPGQLSGAAN